MNIVFINKNIIFFENLQKFVSKSIIANKKIELIEQISEVEKCLDNSLLDLAFLLYKDLQESKSSVDEYLRIKNDIEICYRRNFAILRDIKPHQVSIINGLEQLISFLSLLAIEKKILSNDTNRLETHKLQEKLLVIIANRFG